MRGGDMQGGARGVRVCALGAAALVSAGVGSAGGCQYAGAGRVGEDPIAGVRYDFDAEEEALVRNGAAAGAGEMRIGARWRAQNGEGVQRIFGIGEPQVVRAMGRGEPGAVLELVQIVPERAAVCEPILLAYTVMNSGSGASGPMMILEQLPSGFSAAGGETTIAIPVASLAPGEEQAFAAVLVASEGGEAKFQAIAMGAEDVEARAPEHVMHIVSPRLELEMQVPRRARAGHRAEYIAALRNTGDGDAMGAIVRIEIDGQGDVGSVRVAGRAIESALTLDPVGRIIGVGHLAPDEAVEIRFSVLCAQPGRLEVMATAIAHCAEIASDQVAIDVEGAGE